MYHGNGLLAAYAPCNDVERVESNEREIIDANPRGSRSSRSASAICSASIAFYEALGFARKMRATGEAVAFFDTGGTRDRAVPVGSTRPPTPRCRTSRGRRPFADRRSPGIAAPSRRSTPCWISQSPAARSLLKPAHKTGLRRLLRLFRRSRQPSLGSRGRARHRRRRRPAGFTCRIRTQGLNKD